MSFLPQIFTPNNNQANSPRLNLAPTKYHNPSRFAHPSTGQPYPNDQLDSLDQLSQKKFVPLLPMPNMSNGSFEGPSPRHAVPDRSPMFMANMAPVSTDYFDPRTMNNMANNMGGRNSVLMQMRRDVPPPNLMSAASPARGSILRMGTLQETTPQSRSYSPSVRPMMQRQDTFSDHVAPYTQNAGPMPMPMPMPVQVPDRTPKRDSQFIAPPQLQKRDSSFKKVYDISIRESKSQFSSYQQQTFEKHLERQNTILDKIAGQLDDQRPKDLEKYKDDIDNQIRQLQKKKTMVDMQLQKQKSRVHERCESEPDWRGDFSDSGSANSSVNYSKPSQKNKFQTRMIKQITLAKQQSMQQALEDLDSEYESQGDSEANTPYRDRVQTEPNEKVYFNWDEKDLPDFKIEPIQPSRPISVTKPLKRTESYDPGQRDSLLRKNTESSGDELTVKRYASDHRGDSDHEEQKTPVSTGKKSMGSKMLSVFAKKKARENGGFKVDPETEDSDAEKKASIPKRILDPERSKKAKMRIQSVTWILVSIELLFNESKRRAAEKKAVVNEKIIEKLMPTKKMFKEFAVRVAGKEIETLLTGKQYTSIFVTDKSIPSKKLDKECAGLKDQLKTIFTKMTQNISELPKWQFFDFLKTISKQGSIIPSYYFSDFELRRLKFTYFGALKDIQPSQSKLILGGIMLVRVFIHTIIMQPWEAIDANKPNDHDNIGSAKYNIEKLLNIGSLLYNIVMEIFKDSCPINQAVSNVSREMKIHPKRRLPSAICDSTDPLKFDIRTDASRDGEIIADFYTRQQLFCFFSDRKEMITELKGAIQGFLDALYEKTHK